jgi:hypothetical protein
MDIKRVAEFTDFVAPLHVDAHRQIAAAEPADRSSDLTQRPHDADCE